MKESTSATSPTSSNATKDKVNSTVSGSSSNTTTTATTTTTTVVAATTTTSAAAAASGSTAAGAPAFRDTRAELAQLLKKKEEIEVC